MNLTLFYKETQLFMKIIVTKTIKISIVYCKLLRLLYMKYSFFSRSSVQIPLNHRTCKKKYIDGSFHPSSMQCQPAFSMSLQHSLSQRKLSFIHFKWNSELLCLPSRQCQPRLRKVFLSSSWTSHRVSKQTLPNLTRLNKGMLAAVMRPSQSGHGNSFLSAQRR